MSIIKIDNKDVDLGIKEVPNEDQIKALNHLAEFIKSDKRTCVLNGSAGTGKTFTTKILIKLIKKLYGYTTVLAAPTHKAKIVLQRLAEDGEALTIHSMLGLRPDVSLVEFDAKNLIFLDDIKFFTVTRTLYIIDEASMINDDLFEYLNEKVESESKDNKILYLGDIKQLRPVKQDSKSKVFFETSFPGFTLTNVVRQAQDSNLFKSLNILRNKPIDKFENSYNEDNGLIVYPEIKDFLSKIKTSYINWDAIADPFKYKLLCYTNKRVIDFNKAIRKILGRTRVIEVGDVITGYDNYKNLIYLEDSAVEIEDVKANIYNSNDYIVTDLERVTRELPFYNTVPGYRVTLLDTVDNSNHFVFLLDPELDQKVYDQIAFILESFRLSAIDKKTYYRSRNQYWKRWYKLRDFFVTMKDLTYQGRIVKKATLNYGYAVTVHKSQGSTYENVFIDADDIKICPDINDLRPLQYVAISRAQKFAHVYQKSKNEKK